MLDLRYYQREAIDATYRWFEEKPGDPLIVLPTGTGKSLVIASFCQTSLTSWPDTKILIVTHVLELVKQNCEELIRYWPEAPVGVNNAALGCRDYHQPIIFCSIQSVHRHAFKFGKVDILLVDEAHLIPRDQATMYGRFIKDLRLANPYLKVVGLTATPYRLDSGRLDRGDDRVFDGIAYDYDVAQAVIDGFLTPLRSKRPSTRLSTEGVHKRGGDFIASELQRAVDIDEINRAAVAEILEHGQDRRAWLIFCSGVEHAEHINQLLLDAGVASATIFGDTDKNDRAQRIADFKAGRLRALCSMNVLTTGFNAPNVDLLAMLRPTASTGLYVQMAGRGTRLAPGKEDCLVLDFAGNVERHGPIDAVNPREPGKGDGGEAPTKVCPECGEILFIAVMECPGCGYEFPPPPPKLQTTASTRDIMLLRKAEWVKVTGWSFTRHTKPGKPPSVRVDYECGLTRHSSWICFEHEGYARSKAISWWLRWGQRPVPTTVNEALSRVKELTMPDEIRLKREGRYAEIVDARGVSLVQAGEPMVWLPPERASALAGASAGPSIWDDDLDDDVPF